MDLEEKAVLRMREDDTCPVHQAELVEDHARKEYVSRAKKIYRSVDEAHYNSVRKAHRKHGRRK